MLPGLLLEELCHSPHTLVAPLRQLLDKYVELASNSRRDSRVAKALLFLIRLVTQLESYVVHLLAIDDAATAAAAAAAAQSAPEPLSAVRQPGEAERKVVLPTREQGGERPPPLRPSRSPSFSTSTARPTSSFPHRPRW